MNLKERAKQLKTDIRLIPNGVFEECRVLMKTLENSAPVRRVKKRK